MPQLAVRLFLDIQRPSGDTTMASELVLRFAHRLPSSEWPSDAPKPAVFHFARSLDMDKDLRASLHAKCCATSTARLLERAGAEEKSGLSRDNNSGTVSFRRSR